MKIPQIIECVPNFSEGRNLAKINEITRVIETVPGVKLLHTDPGKSTNRTVVTFAGSPQAVIDAAFLAIQKAAELIDMRTHKGEHPRMGATDVCPLIPISGITMAETVKWAKALAERVGKELHIPVFLYEAAASAPYRSNLADIRAGEYEGLAEKMQDPRWKPDFGPHLFQEKCGATVIGARDFLIAYNVNLNTKSTSLANEVAFDIRYNGRPKRNTETGKLEKDNEGNVIRIPGTCPGVKAIGWYIDEYKLAQVSMNLTDMKQTNLHQAYEACANSAISRGMHVTGSELVGLIPLHSMLEAGRYFLQKQGRSLGVPDSELIESAVQSLGLNAVAPFHPQERIIEYMLQQKQLPLIGLNLRQYIYETAADSPAPGGGSASAYLGALGAALGTMVANLSAHKKGYEADHDFFSQEAQKGQALCEGLLNLVDADTEAFNEIMKAFRLPKNSPDEKKLRKKAIQKATIQAIETPMNTIKLAYQCFDLIRKMALKGNPNSVSDAGVGLISAYAAMQGAALNVKINVVGLENESKKQEFLVQTNEYMAKAQTEFPEIMKLVEQKIGL